ncbi:MAG: histidine kinase dimerization/phosphoacceptor domain -containing protein [Flavobacteriales bacterium]
MSYIHHLEAITQLGSLGNAELDPILQEMGKKLTHCLHVERINIWLFKEKNSCIVCIGNYTAGTDKFSKGEVLFEKDIPSYFSHLKRDKIMAIHDVMTNEIAADLRETYCIPRGISSMMDVPIRIEGKLAGVLCYEHTGNKRKWTDEEQHFALAVNQVVSMAIESQQRKELQVKLEQALHEKELLLAEMHHRIKNNLSILVSLLRIHAKESDTKSGKEVLLEFENNVRSISRLHEQLYSSGSYLKVELSQYIQTLAKEFEASASSTSKPIVFKVHTDTAQLDSGKALIVGLIINEIISNSVKYAFAEKGDSTILVDLKRKAKTISLAVSDNGKGFNPEEMRKNHSLGVSLIYDLCEQLDAKLKVESTTKGTSYLIEFQT